MLWFKVVIQFNRGRWEFGHWKGNFQWTEWTEQNFGETSTGANDLSKIIGFLKIG